MVVRSELPWQPKIIQFEAFFSKQQILLSIHLRQENTFISIFIAHCVKKKKTQQWKKKDKLTFYNFVNMPSNKNIVQEIMIELIVIIIRKHLLDIH